MQVDLSAFVLLDIKETAVMVSYFLCHVHEMLRTRARDRIFQCLNNDVSLNHRLNHTS